VTHPSAVQFTGNSCVRNKPLAKLRSSQGGGIGLGWCGLSLLINGRRFVRGALHLALTFFVLLFFARNLALSLFE
jgi:hypothetical protein